MNLNKIGRYTTPQHTFSLPFSTDEITSISVAYEQNGIVVVEKKLPDCTLGESSVTVDLTEAETAMFNPAWNVNIQLRIGMGDKRINSNIITVNVAGVLREGALDCSSGGNYGRF